MLERGTTLSFKRLFGMHWTWLISWRWEVGFVFLCLREHRNHWKWTLNVVTLFVRLQWTHRSPGCAADRTLRYSHGTLSKEIRSIVYSWKISGSKEVPSEERMSKQKMLFRRVGLGRCGVGSRCRYPRSGLGNFYERGRLCLGQVRLSWWLSGASKVHVKIFRADRHTDRKKLPNIPGLTGLKKCQNM